MSHIRNEQSLIGLCYSRCVDVGFLLHEWRGGLEDLTFGLPSVNVMIRAFLVRER